MRIADHGRVLDVVIVGSWNVNPGYRLVDGGGQTASYPGIAADYQYTFALLKRLPCDVFLGAHGQYFDMLGKLQRRTAQYTDIIWVDPQGFQAAVKEREQAFQAELARQSR
jgi:metallo-beta-lactamase class B